MEIAILTQPLGGNYGGVMQNWALQHVLRQMGHSPVTVDYWQMTNKRRRRMIWKHYKSLLFRRSKLASCPLPSKVEGWRADVRRFVRKNIRLTSPMDVVPAGFWKEHRFDAYLVGSDQVWRPMYNNDIGALGMMFLQPLENFGNIRRIVYGASFGTDEWEYGREDEAMAKRLVRCFDMVSVRERGGIELCERHFGITPEHVLDPTLLVGREEYAKLVPAKYRRKVPPGSAAVYILDYSPEKLAEVGRICASVGRKPYFVGRKDETVPIPPVEEWLAALLECDYMITDSFHGVAFSINFNLPFTLIVNSGRGAARFKSLLGHLGLEDRSDPDAAMRPIDWDSVNSVLEKERVKSIAYFRDALMC